jgi:hypothetical protein
MPHVTVGAENGAVILPYRATAARLPRLIREVKLVTVEGGRTISLPPEEVTPPCWGSSSASQAALVGSRRPVLISACGTTGPDPARFH